jgi:hypothetical protein
MADTSLNPIGAGDPAAAAAEEPAATAELEEAFGQAVGSAVLSMAMNNFSALNETLGEIGKDE